MDRVAVSLQRRRKGLLQRRAFQETRRSTVRIQTAARMCLQRRRFLALRAAAGSLQAIWRGGKFLSPIAIAHLVIHHNPIPAIDDTCFDLTNCWKLLMFPTPSIMLFLIN